MSLKSALQIYQASFRKLINSSSSPIVRITKFSTCQQKGGTGTGDWISWIRRLQKHGHKARNSSVLQAWQVRLGQLCLNMNEKMTILYVSIGRQLNAFAAQRMVRGIQITNFYNMLGYDHHAYKKAIENIALSIIRSNKNKPLGALLGAVLFNWEKEKISDEELSWVGHHFQEINREESGDTVLSDPQHPNDWEKIIDKERITMWRRPINSYLYEYKVFGTFTDIPARAFFNAQNDFDFRKSWDKLIVKLDVMDKDPNSGSDVVQWITHFPYPMYQREYVYVRKIKIDYKKKLMMMVSRAADHPACPKDENKFVRVDTFMSTLLLKPHTSFDENGFDYVLTYHDDPKSNFPSPAYNWMARTGVPDFVDKLHDSAVRFMDTKNKGSRDSDGDSTDASEDNKSVM